MKLILEDGSYIVTNEGIDCSIPLTADINNPRAWYVDSPVIEPVRTENWTGSVVDGGSVNFRNIFFNPHGHGTHTECLGHITPQVYSVNGRIPTGFIRSLLVSVIPEKRQHKDGVWDSVVTKKQLQLIITDCNIEALLIRTLPNSNQKKSTNYSATNPTYFDVDCVELLNQYGIIHFLVDLPSVDREMDNGELAFHHAFWDVPTAPRFDRTITELLYVPDVANDGLYMMHLETAPFENDATPSRPVIFQLHDAENV